MKDKTTFHSTQISVFNPGRLTDKEIENLFITRINVFQFMFINIIAASVLLLPFATAILLVTGFFIDTTPIAAYIVAIGAVLAICNSIVQLFVMRWLLLDIIAPLTELLGFEFHIEKEIEEEDDKMAALVGNILLFIVHTVIIVFLFLLVLLIKCIKLFFSFFIFL